MIKRLTRWLYWRTHERFQGGSMDKSWMPSIGRVGSLGGHLFQVTRITKDDRGYYRYYCIWLGELEDQWNHSTDWKL